ncbi:MAG: alternative ribosome rescue aminoacyl-tRNA hydrolase ArfB [Planctomycetota bacterium]|jgi:ribosome-associated protein|nr:alternative ribosome rescue aminoacyl-tRNA hydrolase ArfB [Planctomycetota bacterium]MDP6988197.1 alternative ribosome rescue aminoacyl-tRNA hydrolase ArfB [Planctomycetota bacterium]
MEPLRVTSRLVIPPGELAVSFSRSGGPGGQNVNKVETRVTLRFDVARSTALSEPQRERALERLAPRLTGEGELILTSSRTRRRARNLADARERLAALLREATAVRKPRKSTRPTQGSVRRRLEEKKRRSQTKRERRELD